MPKTLGVALCNKALINEINAFLTHKTITQKADYLKTFSLYNPTPMSWLQLALMT